MSYDPKVISELSDIVQTELKLWPGFRINKGRKKPFEVIRHGRIEWGEPEIIIVEAFEKRDEAVKAMQRLPIEAAVRHVLARIEELEL